MTATDIVIHHNLMLSHIVNYTQYMKSSASYHPLFKSGGIDL
jgi:hypothetical protein